MCLFERLLLLLLLLQRGPLTYVCDIIVLNNNNNKLFTPISDRMADGYNNNTSMLQDAGIVRVLQVYIGVHVLPRIYYVVHRVRCVYNLTRLQQWEGVKGWMSGR